MLNAAQNVVLAAESPMSGTLATVAFSVIMLVVLYVVMILPQRRSEKRQKLERSKLKVGDQVITIGGLVGKIVNIKDDDITIASSVAQTMVTFRRDAINLMQQPTTAQAAKSEKKK